MTLLSVEAFYQTEYLLDNVNAIFSSYLQGQHYFQTCLANLSQAIWSSVSVSCLGASLGAEVEVTLKIEATASPSFTVAASTFWTCTRGSKLGICYGQKGVTHLHKVELVKILR